MNDRFSDEWINCMLIFLFSTAIATDAEGPVTFRNIESITSTAKVKFPVWPSYQSVRAVLLNDYIFSNDHKYIEGLRLY